MHTRNLLRKAFCYNRQLVWDRQDNHEPIVSRAALGSLLVKLSHQPPAEVLKAAKELGINLVEVGIHAC